MCVCVCVCFHFFVDIANQKFLIVDVVLLADVTAVVKLMLLFVCLHRREKDPSSEIDMATMFLNPRTRC